MHLHNTKRVLGGEKMDSLITYATIVILRFSVIEDTVIEPAGLE
jgi:hypothetical protein